MVDTNRGVLEVNLSIMQKERDGFVRWFKFHLSGHPNIVPVIQLHDKLRFTVGWG